MTGIYRITCVANNKGYVGSSVDIRQRWREHRSELRRGCHSNRHLQNAWRGHGEAAFVFEIIEECSSDILISREQHYVDTLRPRFNGTPIAYPNFFGRGHTEATKAKMRALKLGRPLSAEHRKNLSLAKAGVPQERTPARVRVLLERNKSEKQRAITRAARKNQRPPMLGRKHTAETRALMSQRRKGWVPSPETIQKMCEGQRRRRQRAKEATCVA